LVEAVVRWSAGSTGAVEVAAVAVGGVANTPLRVVAVESALVGGPASFAHIEGVALRAGEWLLAESEPVPVTAYKVPLIGACVAQAFARTFAGESP